MKETQVCAVHHAHFAENCSYEMRFECVCMCVHLCVRAHTFSNSDLEKFLKTCGSIWGGGSLGMGGNSAEL